MVQRKVLQNGAVVKKSVAKVNSKGQIMAIKKGTAYITVKINGKSAKLKVTVKNAITLKKPKISSVEKSIQSQSENHMEEGIRSKPLLFISQLDEKKRQKDKGRYC